MVTRAQCFGHVAKHVKGCKKINKFLVFCAKWGMRRRDVPDPFHDQSHLRIPLLKTMDSYSLSSKCFIFEIGWYVGTWVEIAVVSPKIVPPPM